MKHIMVILAVAIVSLAAQSAQAQNSVDYKTAYERAQAGDKPLLVLVTAEWCPPCQDMKNTTIPRLLQKSAFKDFHYSTVDLDKDSKIARQLIGDRGVPQLIMYEKQDGKWLRRYLRGYKTAETVEAFVAQANTMRTASAKDAVNK
jgi:thiol:disulfide interchange protein